MAGVPRYAFGEALRGAMNWVRGVVPPSRPADRLAGELTIWHLAGRLYGRYLQRAPVNRFPGPYPEATPADEPYGDDAITESRTR